MKTKKMTNYLYQIKNGKFIKATLFGLILLMGSFIANFYAGIYATANAGNAVTDIILSNIPTYDVDGIFIYGPLVLYTVVTFLCLKKPNRIPFVLKSISLLVLMRSISVILTHIGPFPDHIVIHSDFIKKFTFDGDLFFSGHTALPFLMALLFWENMYLRIVFIATSILFGIIVLMAHLHYSIDVLAAFFITYTVFHISEKIFKKDQRIFKYGINEIT